MKQVLQSLRNGATEVADIPTPSVGRGQVLIETAVSLVSAGTERMLVDFGKANLIDKARQQPEKVMQVLEKARTDGLAATAEAVLSKLDQPVALGYCNVGRVQAVGSGVGGYSVGDRVASNGKHAEFVAVPKNLCAKVPDSVSDEAAAFTVMGAIGLQGIRLADAKLGETVVVIGLGLIGLMTVQMLRAQGCRVLGVDLNPARLDMARRFGAETANPATGEDPIARAQTLSRGLGADAVLITASTKSNEPVAQAARMLRKRGRIVLVGVTGLALNRADFYEKEISFQVSCSYGPGRYDATYEEGGQDYPVGFVRWTEQRNFEAVLDLMASGALDVAPLISHRFDLEQAERAFALLSSGEASLGILLKYKLGGPLKLSQKVTLAAKHDPGAATTAFLGAGNYAGRVLIPAFKAAGAHLNTVVSGGGVSAVHFGRKHAFEAASTASAGVLDDPTIDTVVVATRHNAHASQVLSSLQAGKHVFCEKPLCLTIPELEAIEREAAARPGQKLMVGFNRRFAPLTIKAKSLLDRIDEPKAMIMTVNAGDIPQDHWTQDPEVGGGRIVGEACHFIDLLRHLAGARISSWSTAPLRRGRNGAAIDDRTTVSISFEDGSTGFIHYLANGHKAFPKERLEVFAGGRILQLDNFRTMRGWGWRGFAKAGGLRQDKGQLACAAAFVNAVKHDLPAPIPVAEIFEVSRVAIEAAKAART